jgi:hypothetical protein
LTTPGALKLETASARALESGHLYAAIFVEIDVWLMQKARHRCRAFRIVVL